MSQPGQPQQPGTIQTHDEHGQFSSSYIWLQRFEPLKQQWGWRMYNIIDDEQAGALDANAPTTIQGAPPLVNELLQQYFQMNQEDKEVVHLMVYMAIRRIPPPANGGRRRTKKRKTAGRRHRKTAGRRHRKH